MNGFDAPYIDYAGISPLIALTAGTCVTLLAGLFPGARLVLVDRSGTLAAAAGLSAWQFGESKSLVEGALRSDDLSLSLSFVFYASAAVALLLSLGERGDRPSALGDYAGLLLASVTGMVVLASSINLVTLFVGIELLSIPLYVMCALDLHRRTSLESGLKYLVIGSIGSATLLYGLAFIYGASSSTDFAEIARAIGDGGIAGDPLLLTGIALTAAGPRLQGLGRPVPPVDTRRLRGRADVGDGIHGGRDEDGRVRDPAAAVRRRAPARQGRLGRGARRAGGGDDRDREHRRDRPGVAEAAARVFRRGAGGLHAGRCARRHGARREGRRLLPVRVSDHEHGRIRGGCRAGARVRARGTTSIRWRGSERRGRRWRGR